MGRKNSIRAAVALLALLASVVGTSLRDWWYCEPFEAFAVLDRLSWSRVLLIGDSITAGAEGRLGLDVTLRGVPGARTDHLLAHQDGIGLATHPEFVFLMVGANDSDYQAEVLRRLLRVIRQRAPRAHLILVTCPPARLGRERDLRHAVTRAMQIGVAAEEGVELLDLWADLADSRGSMRAEFTTDGLHWTAGAYETYGRAIRALTRR